MFFCSRRRVDRHATTLRMGLGFYFYLMLCYFCKKETTNTDESICPLKECIHSSRCYRFPGVVRNSLHVHSNIECFRYYSNKVLNVRV